MTSRTFGIIIVIAVIIVSMLTAILEVSRSDQARALHAERADIARARQVLALDAYRICLSAQRVRRPFDAYIVSQLALVNEARRQHIPLGPPSLRRLNERSLQNLRRLEASLAHSVAAPCKR